MKRVADRALRTSNRTIRSQPMAAIDNQYSATNKTRRIRTQKHSRLFDIRDSAETAQWNGLPQTFFDRLRHQTLHSFRVFDWARRDRVDAYSISSPLNGEVTRQRIDTG